MVCDSQARRVDAHLPASFQTDGGHRYTSQTARGDVVEACQVWRNVQRKPVHCDPLPDAYADGSNLPVSYPDTCLALDLPGTDAELCDKINQEGFKHAQIPVQVSAADPEVQNRIAHKLTGPVIGGLAATVRLEHRVGKSSRVAQ